MKRIAIFGGSFDPVHLGHLKLVSAAREKAGFDRVIFMPCWQSPFKGRTVASGEQRFEMLKLAINEAGISSWAEVSDYEISRAESSYSWQTAEHFNRLTENTDIEWWWILGTDQWDVIDQWAEPDKLRQLLNFVVMTRDGAEVAAKRGWSHLAVPFAHPASSTAIRTEFKRHHEWLPSSVVAYCESHSIYL